MTNTTDPSATVKEQPPTLRLVWPQWQGASVEAVRAFFSEVPLEEARRGYAVGAAVLNAVLPAHTGPTAFVPVESGDRGLGKQDGIEAKEAVIAQLAGAVAVIGRHSPQRILTLGGECSVGVAPFSWLAARYGDDLAVLWIDAHPDVGTPASHYAGYHAMAVAVLTGHKAIVDIVAAGLLHMMDPRTVPGVAGNSRFAGASEPPPPPLDTLRIQGRWSRR